MYSYCEWYKYRRYSLCPTCLCLTCSEDVAAAVTTRGEVVVMAVSAVELVVLGGERLIDERVEAVTALEAFLVPVLVLVRQVLHNTPATVNACMTDPAQHTNNSQCFYDRSCTTHQQQCL